MSTDSPRTDRGSDPETGVWRALPCASARETAGRYTVNVVPWFGTEATVMVPLWSCTTRQTMDSPNPVSYTHLRAHETRHDLVCRLLLEKKKKTKKKSKTQNET